MLSAIKAKGSQVYGIIWSRVTDEEDVDALLVAEREAGLGSESVQD